ncbi:MAG: hypothetical protein IPN11_02645 [Opitutaceae bacterium]|nr:hypothetical protein [Opitutaceae bacterium]
MKLHVLLSRLALAVALAGLTVCATAADSAPRRRIAELSSAFAQLPPAAQKQVRERNVARGQTFEMIYIILGTPDYVETSADGGETQWLYKKFYQQVKVMGVELFPTRAKRDKNTKLRADPMDHLLLGASSQTREEYARANTQGGFEMPKPPRESPDADDPLLPGAELEILFQGAKVADIKVTRDFPLSPGLPAKAP